MTDRELLESAARAAGMIPREFIGNQNYMDGVLDKWRPLEDDGDALRLLTSLPFRELYVSEIGATVSWRRDDGNGHGFKCDEYASEHNGDLNAATRRAITRAAAAIGEKVK